MSSTSQYSTKTTVPDISELNRAHVDAKASRRNNGKNSPLADVKDIDIRNWCVQWRTTLVKGEIIPILIGNVLVAEIRKPMLNVTSVKAQELCKAGKIELPTDTDKDGVNHLLHYFSCVANTKRKPTFMNNHLPTYQALSVCAAAALLGMDKYTDHVYKMCEAKLRADPAEYEDIDAILAFEKHHARLFKVVVNDLATHVWNDTLPDKEDFAAYLAENPVLETAIKAANDAYAEKDYLMETREERRMLREEYQARRKEREQRFEDRKAEYKARWAAINTKNAALEKSCREKSSGAVEKRKQFDANERRHWISTRQCQPPKGC
ncbi:hypothetical protein FB567DRAFT_530713 [Paraphoma chrysanthemicola]|uniref:Uncharacterized protein n=1 Tax=Paraphoma chrysanthemicola TaxID=798071 RepID=A0A8K0VWM5_9PLEO|nr:hypothetical protein FB567DRAFT_530713 [Paraphoma chrysanthemicola]